MQEIKTNSTPSGAGVRGTQAPLVDEDVVTRCPICGAPLRINTYLRDSETWEPNACWGSSEAICNKMLECSHYHWVPVGNACFEDPSADPVICVGVSRLKEEAIDRVWDGTSVWLLVPRSLTGDE